MDDLDPIDRTIINRLQGGFPLDARPFRVAGGLLDLHEEDLIARLRRLLDQGKLSRFGPMWNAQALGGDVCLCAMAVPAERFDAVTDQVNAHPEVAHNYQRSHTLNMWFVISAERPEQIEGVAAAIERETGLNVHRMPKLNEFFVGFRVEV